VSALDIERRDGVPIAHVTEDLDAANAANAQRQLDGALGPDASSLIVDLGDIRYLDSAAIDMLLRLGDRLDHRRAKLILVIPETSQLMRLVAIVGLPAAIAVHPTLSAALQQAAKVPAPHSTPGGTIAGGTTAG
jgi:anti-anti-sigma factor